MTECRPGGTKFLLRTRSVILLRSTPLKPENITHVGVSEWRTAKHPDALRTTLGSCVGIVLYSKKDRAGGMCHALLDEPPPGKIAQKGKYARTAIEELLRELQRQGIDKTNLTARVFGGASMFDSERSKFFHNIGDSNVATTRSVLQKENIQILEEDVGGNCGRTITFFLDDGRILLRAGTQERYIYKS